VSVVKSVTQYFGYIVCRWGYKFSLAANPSHYGVHSGCGLQVGETGFVQVLWNRGGNRGLSLSDAFPQQSRQCLSKQPHIDGQPVILVQLHIFCIIRVRVEVRVVEWLQSDCSHLLELAEFYSVLLADNSHSVVNTFVQAVAMSRNQWGALLC